QKILATTRDSLGNALRHQDKLEPLLQQMPERTAKLAEHLPKIGRDLAKLLRDTERFGSVAQGLRKAHKSLASTLERWPEICKALAGSSAVLKTTQKQLDHALKNRGEYEKAQQQTTALVEAFSSALPELSQQLTIQLREEERSVTEVQQSLQALGT